ncbi:hypothetical protein [Pseudothauera rhizosphaerae]|uniref:Uncharacterized protein n=1 Tax=Pseudothauera rhizosphaerae TaxID=2565932 RepID=A0A4S4AEQ6_9RHOO|nr:hypothetical protein [Pseudothauera rhizosphaerae]THF57629.1 hypothetical protein E6O51_17525 [Pseudothauera rhizosphaerae]
MKSTLKKLSSILSLTLQTAASFAAVILFSKKTNLATPARTANNAIVLGNGPSLKNGRETIKNARREGDFDIWSVNLFANSDFFESIKPTHYVLADSSHWKKDISQEVKSLLDGLQQSLNQKTKWPLTLIVPYEARNSEFIEKISNKNISIKYYNRVPATGFPSLIRILYDKNLALPPAYNVLIATTFLAISAKYKNIYIFGADHSWHEEIKITEKNILEANQTHFYDNEAPPRPIYKDAHAQFNIGEIFIRWGQVFNQYYTLNEYAKTHNIKIKNASSKTYIDAFERIPADSIVTDAHLNI